MRVVQRVIPSHLSIHRSQVRQARPAGATLQDYGMPSNHAQTTTFLALYCVLLLWHGCTVRHALFSKPI